MEKKEDLQFTALTLEADPYYQFYKKYAAPTLKDQKNRQMVQQEIFKLICHVAIQNITL